MAFHHQILSILCLSFWIVSYVLILRQARVDRRVGMPLVPLCINVSYEFIFGFVYPDIPPMCHVNRLWFAVDLLLVAQYLRYGREEFTALLPRRWFVPSFVLTLVLAYVGVLAVTAEFNDYVGGNYSGWGDQLLLSASFIFMLTRRRSSAGQSMYIALSRVIGTICLIPVQHALMPNSPLMMYLYASFLILDAIYIVLLYRQCRVEGRPPWAWTAAARRRSGP